MAVTPLQQAQADLHAYQTALGRENLELQKLNTALDPAEDLRTIHGSWNRTIVPALSQRLINYGALRAQSQRLEETIKALPVQQDRDTLNGQHAQVQRIFEQIRGKRSQLEGLVWDRQQEMISGKGTFAAVRPNTVPISIQNSNPVIPTAPDYTSLRLVRQADGKYTLQGIDIQQQGLLSRTCSAVWNNKVKILGAVALGLTGLAVASNFPAAASYVNPITAFPGKAATAIGTAVTSAKEWVTPMIDGVTPHATMENVASAASATWASIKTVSELRKGNKTKALGYALTGVAVGVAPHVIKGSMNETVEATQALGSKALSGVSGLFGSFWGWAKEVPGISHTTKFVTGAPEFFNTRVVEPFVKNVAPHLTGANVISAGTALLATPAATVKTWRSGYRKSAVGVALGGLGLAAGVALAPHAYSLGAQGSFDKVLGGLSSLVGYQTKTEL